MKNILSLARKIFIDQEYRSKRTDDLKGTVVIVTGASKGIGYGICASLLHAGATVIGVARNVDGLAKKLSSFSESFTCVAADVTNEESVRHLINGCLDKFRRIDGLINCAGVVKFGAIEKTTLADYRSTESTNIQSVYLLSREVLPSMKKRRSGTIITIGSKISHNTNVESNKSLYAMSKYAVEGFCFALNREVRPYGVRVICLMPGTVRTFFSTKAGNFLSPFDIGDLVTTIFRLKTIDFESIVVKSTHQNI